MHKMHTLPYITFFTLEAQMCKMDLSIQNAMCLGKDHICTNIG